MGIAAVSGGGFDANGNLIGEGIRVMVYDVMNRLLSVASASNPSQPYLRLYYDPEGRLYQYAVKNASDNNYTSTYFSYDGVNLIGEYDASGTPIRQYVHGTGTDEPIVWFEGSNYSTKRYFVQNYQGSVIGYTDASGNLQEVYKYGPWGESLVASATTPDLVSASFSGSRFRYTGQTTLPDASLYYYKARVYDPQMGRFLQTDPIGSKDDLDLYVYTGGDPVNKTDPTGLLAGPKNGRSTLEDSVAVIPLPPPPIIFPDNIEQNQGDNVIADGLNYAWEKIKKRVKEDMGDTYWFVTYTKTDPKTGDVYAGYTSGYGYSPYDVLAKRDYRHHKGPMGFGPAVIDRHYGISEGMPGKMAWGFAAARGREQLLIEKYGALGKSGNDRNGIDPKREHSTVFKTVAFLQWGVP